MILTEKQQKYQHYYPEKIDEYEYLTGEEILHSNQRQILEQAKFAYSPLGKAFEKQTKKQVGAIKSLDPSNKLKRIEDILPQTLMNDLICAKLKEVVEWQVIIKKDDWFCCWFMCWNFI